MTDEDSGDENTASFVQLPGRMLRSAVELQPRAIDENQTDSSSEDTERTGPRAKKKKKKDVTVILLSLHRVEKMTVTKKILATV